MPYGINVESWDEYKMWPHSSSANILFNGDYDRLADDFIQAFPDLCRNGYGSDPRYAMWLRNLMPLMHDGWYPEMDCISSEEISDHYFKKGDECFPHYNLPAWQFHIMKEYEDLESYNNSVRDECCDFNHN